MNTLVAIFFILHGLVHLLYAGQSLRRFELKPGLTWPDGSWAFAKILGAKNTRLAAAVCLALAAAGFAVGGVALLLQQPWWRALIAAAAAFSSLLYLLLWDAKLHRLDEQGLIGILINIAILLAALVFHWPA